MRRAGCGLSIVSALAFPLPAMIGAGAAVPVHAQERPGGQWCNGFAPETGWRICTGAPGATCFATVGLFHGEFDSLSASPFWY